MVPGNVSREWGHGAKRKENDMLCSMSLLWLANNELPLKLSKHASLSLCDPFFEVLGNKLLP